MNSPDASTAESRLRQQARQCSDTQQWEAAQATLESLATLIPEDAGGLAELANVVFRRGRLRESAALLLRVARRLPRDARLIMTVAQRLVAVGETLAARGCLDLLAQAPEPPPELPRVWW